MSGTTNKNHIFILVLRTELEELAAKTGNHQLYEHKPPWMKKKIDDRIKFQLKQLKCCEGFHQLIFHR